MGFFTLLRTKGVKMKEGKVAIPFRVGWGFSLGDLASRACRVLGSQSLSGWDGVFHLTLSNGGHQVVEIKSQSLSGWDGVFHSRIIVKRRR